jgi:hypothetical protein
VWPVSFATPKAEVKAIHLIDWTASRSAVGAGVYLLRKNGGAADMLLTIGGSGYEEPSSETGLQTLRRTAAVCPRGSTLVTVSDHATEELEDAHKALEKFSPGSDGYSFGPEGMAGIEGHEFHGTN